MDIQFFREAIRVYELANISEEMWMELHEALFVALSKIQPEELTEEHLEFMEKAEKFYSINEKFEKADILSKIQIAAKNIFEARRKIEEIKNKMKK